MSNGPVVWGREQFEQMKNMKKPEDTMFESRFYRMSAPKGKGSAPNVYTIRILPPKSLTNPFFYQFYTRHFFDSNSIDSKIDIICPKNDNPSNKCALCDHAKSLFEKAETTGDEKYKNTAKKYYRTKTWLLNVIVKQDPVNKDKNGTVQVLQVGEQIFTKIETGMSNPQIGFAVVDVSPAGLDLIINATKNAMDFPNYESSEFARIPSSATQGTALTLEQAMEQAQDLKVAMGKVSTTDEVIRIMNEHVLCEAKQSAPVFATQQVIPQQFATQQVIPQQFAQQPVVQQPVIPQQFAQQPVIQQPVIPQQFAQQPTQFAQEPSTNLPQPQFTNPAQQPQFSTNLDDDDAALLELLGKTANQIKV